MLKSLVRGSTLAALGVLCLGALIASSVSAGTFAKTTYLKFSGDVALPAIVLPAGDYIFELANPDTSRDVVRVMNRQRSRMFLQALTRRTARNTSSLAGRVTLGESRAGAPRPIVAWYPAGETTGYEFIY